MILSLGDWVKVFILMVVFVVFIISIVEGIRGEIDYQKWNKSVRLRKDKI